MKNLKRIAIPVSLGIIGLVLLNSCSVGIPKGATAVKNFDADRYLGKWYEIARFDYRFEKDMDNVTATYSKNPDGSIKVDNRGYNYVKKEWKESIGEARFVNDQTEARLKVSFFKPIWAGYNVIEIDDDYQYALVVGNNLKYIWILSRTTTIPEHIRQKFLEKAKSIGYNTDELIWVKHNQ
ncbi:MULTISPECIES: lipocalin family protein [Chryseobacterium]|uniref:Apolipoprotein D and lipocalin family protein n=1 Tax=Chryseobacterium camelliae TaxID=1265445 RepID=A0ABU0TE05_9FLAO|nr:MULTISPECIES: lipocalin family protein [Chryseobacterium]MDT3406899.1 apolipoprotein D and lipocalin family protein [Pseudacidovorax intermedius]MDQ1095307.1 apolipoprotein D and lipocalin family protein [Chryseobacterium camelliae]MDQ1099246.1 apolipoprotein D and lipocalin family protein [Chryseobacterium sp. SORGH_AS_1048]MDR6086595.1 apolipoprotein D and lipocalin family protein [Chryseobacterium sp. SORGH_AS_0909]MDR6130965.1 apolipoprotein D and lipocalin family protein [Chryseobacter